MKSYRLYVLSRQERVAEAREALFENDTAALAGADKLKEDNYAVEVWTGERLVGRLGAEFRL
jgi:hypothetical protein